MQHGPREALTNAGRTPDSGPVIASPPAPLAKHPLDLLSAGNLALTKNLGRTSGGLLTPSVVSNYATNPEVAGQDADHYVENVIPATGTAKRIGVSHLTTFDQPGV